MSKLLNNIVDIALVGIGTAAAGIIATTLLFGNPAAADRFKETPFAPGDTVQIFNACLEESDILETWAAMLAQEPNMGYAFPDGVACLHLIAVVKVEAVLTCLDAVWRGFGLSTTCILAVTEPGSKLHPDEEFYTIAITQQIIDRAKAACGYDPHPISDASRCARASGHNPAGGYPPIPDTPGRRHPNDTLTETH